MPPHRLGSLLRATGLGVALASCFSDPGSVGGTNESCTPGEQRDCGCLGPVTDGFQVCREDGSGYDPCQCGAATDAGSGPTSAASTSGTASTTSGTSEGTTMQGGTDSTGGGSGSSGGSTASTVNPDAIILFATLAIPGDFAAGGSARTTVDAMCTGGRPAQVTGFCDTTHAVICLAATDAIATFAVDFAVPPGPVESGDGTLIASSWLDMVTAPTLASSLSEAGVLTQGPWTGCDTLGMHVASADCEAWTAIEIDMKTPHLANFGDPDATDETWMVMPDSTPCPDPRPILCACWSTL